MNAEDTWEQFELTAKKMGIPTEYEDDYGTWWKMWKAGFKARDEADFEEMIQAIDSLTGKIKQKHGKTSVAGCIPCPICKGSVDYIVSAVNGHVHGKCGTKDCLSWVE